jgi:type III pantothenate kinase
MLLLDVGNSRIKWAQVKGDQWLQQGATGIAEWPILQQVFATLAQPHKILVSNVAGDDAAQQIRAVCAAWRCPVEFINARAEQCGLRNAYDQPEQLGSDRWAALIAAWHHERAACLVVSCGTATTIDALSGTGEFLGGLILPGVNMMRRSLAAGTAQLKMSEENRTQGSWREFPRNTADAIASGAIQATVGAILQQYELLGVPGARCLLSGGAADSVQPHLGIPLLQVDNLVLQGLQIIGQQNLQEQGAIQ